MKTPKYFVSLGGVNLHRVKSFELSSDRDIEEYDGVGSGKFNVPDAHNPRQWTIECELLQNGKELAGRNSWSASEIFKEFEAWLGKSDAPIRMVKTDAIYPAANLSALVWMKSYKPKESDEQGVYDTEIIVEEYKPVGIRTTGIPYVARPGKIPIPPKVTVKSAKTIYRLTRGNVKHYQYNGTDTHPAHGNQNLQRPVVTDFKNFKTGKPVTNPNTVPKNATLLLGSYVTNKSSTSSSGSTGYSTMYSTGQKSNAQKWLESVGTAISNAFNSWTKNASNNKIKSLGG